MFADRVAKLKNEGAYKVLAEAQELEAAGRDIVHLEIGQPDLPTPAPIVQVLNAAPVVTRTELDACCVAGGYRSAARRSD